MKFQQNIFMSLKFSSWDVSLCLSVLMVFVPHDKSASVSFGSVCQLVVVHITKDRQWHRAIFSYS